MQHLPPQNSFIFNQQYRDFVKESILSRIPNQREGPRKVGRAHTGADRDRQPPEVIDVVIFTKILELCAIVLVLQRQLIALMQKLPTRNKQLVQVIMKRNNSVAP